MEMVEIWKHVPSPVPAAGQVKVTMEDDHVIQGGEGDRARTPHVTTGGDINSQG